MKSMSFVLMGLMVMGLLAADYFVLTTSWIVGDLVQKELDKVFGPLLTYEGKIQAGFDGRIKINGVQLRVARDGPVVLKCDSLTISMEAGRTREIRLDNPEFFLTPEVGDYLKELDSKIKTDRNTEPLPLVTCMGGKVRFGDLNKLLSRKTPWFAIERFTLHPIESEGYYIRGRVEDQNRKTWRVTGELDFLRRKMDLKVQLKDLSIANLQELLPEEVLKEWARWDPQGRASIDLQVTTGEGTEKTELITSINVEDLALKFRDVTVSNLAGRIRGSMVTDEAGQEPHVHFNVDLHTREGHTALPGGGQLRVRGAFEQVNGDAPFDLTFELSDAPIEAMKRALPNEYAELWDRIQPTGRVTLSGTVTHKGASMVTAEINGAEASIQPLGRVRDMEGRVELAGETITISLLKGRQGSAEIRLEGTVERVLEKQPTLNLTVRVEDFPVARFVEVGEEQYSVTDVIRAWDGESFDQAGTVDVELRLIGPADKLKPELIVDLKGNRLAYAEIPLPLEEIIGRIRITEGRTTLEYVNAIYVARTGRESPVGSDVKKARIRVSGWSSRKGKTPHSEYRAELQKVRINEAFTRRLPDPVRRIVEAMKLEGDANILASVQTRGSGPESSIDFNCELRLFGATLNPGLKLENVTGSILMDGAGFTEGSTVAGKLNFTEATVEGHRLTNLNASFTVRGSTLSFGSISANAYGGILQASVSVNTRSGEFRGEFFADRIDLKDLTNTIKGYSERGLSGIVSVRDMTLAGHIGDSATFKGEGVCTVDEGHLWGVPVFMKLFSLKLNEVFEDRPTNLRGLMTFTIRDSKMVIEGLRLGEDDLEIVGRGKIQFDGVIDLILKTNSDMLGVHIPGITDLLNAAKNEVQAWRATGTFNEPEMSLRFFPGLASPED